MEIEKLLNQQKKEIVEEIIRRTEGITRHIDVIKEKRILTAKFSLSPSNTIPLERD